MKLRDEWGKVPNRWPSPSLLHCSTGLLWGLIFGSTQYKARLAVANGVDFLEYTFVNLLFLFAFAYLARVGLVLTRILLVWGRHRGPQDTSFGAVPPARRTLALTRKIIGNNHAALTLSC